jgi:hypothetical protein
MISLHGGICSYFDKTKEEIIPFIKENVLNSLQILSIPPRNCVNWVSNEILNNCINMHQFEQSDIENVLKLPGIYS